MSSDDPSATSPPRRPATARLQPSRSSCSADGGRTGIGTSRGFTARDTRPGIGHSRAASTSSVEWRVPLQVVRQRGRSPLVLRKIVIAERKRASLAGPAREVLRDCAYFSKDGLGISNDPIDRRGVREETKFSSRSPDVGDFVYNNQPLGSRQACTETRMPSWTDDRIQNCTGVVPFDCRNVRRQNCTEFGRQNSPRMGHLSSGFDRHGSLPARSPRSRVKNTKPQRIVEETQSWISVVKPYGGLRINEGECSLSPLRGELVAGAVEGSDERIPQLDEQQWPSLSKSTLWVPKREDNSAQLKQLDEEDQKQEDGVGKYVPDAMLLMLNKDFMVSAPVKENLLLTLSLTTERKCSKQQQIFVGHFTAFSSYLHFVLGRDARRVRTESNAGGTSTISESLSVEYFVRKFQAKDIVTEMEVEYCSLNWKKVDYICTIYGHRVGVSVTRAMSFPNPKDFSAQMACRLLHKKLFGLVIARHGVSKRHSFSQCILHVWCETPETSCILQQEYEGVSKELDIVDDVIMVLTIAKGWHERSIFYESILKNDVL